MSTRLAAIVGVRPQYIKAAALRWELEQSRSSLAEGLLVVDVRQHYDHTMRETVLADIGLEPDVTLPVVGGGTRGRQFFAQLAGLVDAIVKLQPAGVVVFGDADPAALGGLAAAKLGLPYAHIEAGARRDPREQEDYNSRIVDARAELKLCVTERALHNLETEGLGVGAVVTGDMAWRWYRSLSPRGSPSTLNRAAVLVTIHRPQNLHAERFRTIRDALEISRLTAAWVSHPRYSRELLSIIGSSPFVQVMAPQSFLAMMSLVADADVVLSDSGGLIREAHLVGKPVVICRPRGGWPELEAAGLAARAGDTVNSVMQALQSAQLIAKPRQTSPLVVPNGIETGVERLEEWADGCD